LEVPETLQNFGWAYMLQVVQKVQDAHFKILGINELDLEILWYEKTHYA